MSSKLIQYLPEFQDLEADRRGRFIKIRGNRPVSDRKDKKIFNCQDFRILGPYSSFFKAPHGVIWGNNRRRFCSVSKAMSYIVKISTGLDNIQLSAALLYLHWKGMYMPTSNS